MEKARSPDELYKQYKGECQYCGMPLDIVDWVIHKGKIEDYPVHVPCESQIQYEDSL
jgi:hypothetical protein